MNKSVRGAIIAGVVLILVLGAGFIWYQAVQPNENTSQVTSQNDTADKESNDATTDQRVITFTTSGFTPSSLTARAGDTITIKNESTSAVQFSSDDHPTHREHPEINMPDLQPGDSEHFTIEKAGTYTYHDHINARYTGTIVITE